MLIAIVALVIGAAMMFVWAMQREIDVSTPAARAQQVEAMVFGCKVRLPEVLKTAQIDRSLAPDEMNKVCGCAVEQIIDDYAVAGKLKPSDVAEDKIDAAQLACLKNMTAP